MNKNNFIIYIVLFFSLFFMASISLLSLLNDDIEIPQKESIIKLDIESRFSLDLAGSKENYSLRSSN
jgi:hypothetical protein